MSHLASLMLSVAGFVVLALATGRQQREIFGKALPRNASRLLRGAGFLLLIVALAVAIRAFGVALGLVAFSGHTSVAAGVVYCGIIVYSRRIQTGSRRQFL